MEHQAAATQGDAQQLAAMMAQMMGQIKELRNEQVQRLTEMENRLATEREAYDTQIKALQESFASFHSTPGGNTLQHPSPISTTQQTPLPSVAPPASPAVPPSQVKKKPTLPDPPRFDGVRRKFRAWKQEMESKLETDGSTIGSERDQFAYVFARLGDSPQAMVSAFYSFHRESGTGTTKEFLRYLSSCYEDPNIAQRALDRLNSLTQGDKEPFASFLPKFEKEMADAGGANWAPAVKISYLKKALNHEMRRELRGQLNMPKEYGAYVSSLHDLGANLDEFRSFSQQRNPPRFKHGEGQSATPAKVKTPPPRTPSPNAMDWESSAVNKSSLPSQVSKSSQVKSSLTSRDLSSQVGTST
jgi:hypothetical protein